MPLSLPLRPDLDQLKKQAKDLLHAWRSGEQLHLVSEHHPERAMLAKPQTLQLSDAQLVLARRCGFASWPRLKEEVSLRLMAFSERAKHFVRLVADPSSGGFAQPLLSARRLFAREPQIVQADIYTALVSGDIEVVQKQLRKDPAWAKQKGGPYEDRAPLLYVTYSRWHGEDPKIAKNLLEIARLLLSSGASVHETFEVEGSLLSALYGACGATNFPEMAKLLLEHGAQPDDHESLYHSIEFVDNQCLTLLLNHKAKIKGTNALHHALDRRDTAALTLLLQNGADPNEENGAHGGTLHAAIERGKGPEVLSLLLRHGADLHQTRADGRSAYQLALLYGNFEAAQYLASQGAVLTATPFERLVDACARNDLASAQEIVRAAPEIFSSLTPHENDAFLHLAGEGKTQLVSMLLSLGFPTNARGSFAHTALHWAAWRGQPEMVALLLSKGAALEAKEEQFGSTPLGWSSHGSEHAQSPKANHLEVVRLLLAAGAEVNVTNKWGEVILPDEENPVTQLLLAAGVKRTEE